MREVGLQKAGLNFSSFANPWLCSRAHQGSPICERGENDGPQREQVSQIHIQKEKGELLERGKVYLPPSKHATHVDERVPSESGDCS